MAYPMFMKFWFLRWVQISSTQIAVQSGICFDLQFYTRMDKHEFVSSTGSENAKLAKADDDDDGLDDYVNVDSDDNEGIKMQLWLVVNYDICFNIMYWSVKCIHVKPLVAMNYFVFEFVQF